MMSEIQIKNTLKTLIEELKDSFDNEDMDYLGGLGIKNYDKYVQKLMIKIRMLVLILELSDNDFELLFDSIKRR